MISFNLTGSTRRKHGFLKLAFGLASFALFQANPALATPKIILIIRHGEKVVTPDGDENSGDLTPKGLARAAALATAIPKNFPRPDFIFAAANSKKSHRVVDTVTPLSKALGEPLDTDFKNKEFADLAQEVLTDPKYDGKVVLIAWHHGHIPELAHALGATQAPDEWDPTVFDRVWVLTYHGATPTWRDEPEKALPGDSTASWGK